MGGMGARGFLAALAVLCCADAAHSAVLGIDYGSEFIKVSIVAPGRTPISIVINEISKRKSTAAVSFTDGRDGTAQSIARRPRYHPHAL